MTPIAVILMVVVFVVIDTIVVGAVISMAMEPVKKFAAKYPARPMREPYERREFGTIRMSMSNFSKCVHLTVDRDHLHIEPAAMLRWLGMTTISLPRKEIVVPEGKVKWMMGKGLEVRIAKEPIWVPEWCVEELRELRKNDPIDQASSSVPASS